MTAPNDRFDITGDLPTGTTLLEASAGTGKTWTIGSLVTRFVAEEGVSLERMLVVTFGRAASQELRERVRAQLVEAERYLAADPAPTPEGSAEPSILITHLLACDATERALRHRRVVAALASFDAATIATTHQFCSMVLGSLGVAGDTDAHAHLVEDLEELMSEVVDDLYLRAFAHADTAPVFTFEEAMSIARTAVGDPQARLEPSADDRATPSGRRVAFAHAVRAEMDRRKRRLGILSYDDLLSQLASALEAPDAPARARMRQRWQIVLVDEFQDTDPVQWQVLDRAFSGHATMVLIGDPKQAIYAFRGGDVTTYLQAREQATSEKTLAVNWRSDQALVDGLQTMLSGASLGDPRILVRDVTAHHQGSRLQGAPHPDPFRLRVIRRDQFRRRGVKGLFVNETRPHIAADLAHDIRELLASGATFDGEPLAPRDVAVIAYAHRELRAAQHALREVGVPAVIAGGGSVFGTEAAVEWLVLLEALEQPHRAARVRSAALTCFVGRSARDLDEGGPGAATADELTDQVADQMRRWAEVFGQRGVAAVLEAASAAGLPGRVLAQVGGERLLTDLRHVGEVLHEVALTDRLGLVALVAWLRGQIAEGRGGRGTERTRRLDSDAAAVQLVTIHASKGLEYAVVYLPSLADRAVQKPRTPLFHDEEGQRCLDVGGPGGGQWSTSVERWRTEDSGEWLRLLYVALTRAKSQVVCWWAPTKNTPASPLQRMLIGRRPDLPEVPDEVALRTDDETATFLDRWRESGGPVPEIATPAPLGTEPPTPPEPLLQARSFTRGVDVTWRRTSYSSLTARPDYAAHASVVAATSEPEVSAKDDESDDPQVTTGDSEPRAAQSVPSPMADLPLGATFGSLVHAVLEHTDPDAPDLRAELLGHIDEQRVWWPVEVEREALADALIEVCDSPLGPLVGRTLREIPLRDRLRELDFELPLAGGDLAGGGIDGPLLGDLASLLREHLPVGDPVRGYADALTDPHLGEQALRGYLTGSVDVVLRVSGPHGPTYVVVDYKTNWLGPREEPLTADSYRPEALDEAMGHSDYPLQALLYAVVLHRFLRWRQPDYDPHIHLGGVLYLYLRGMCGPGTPLIEGRPCGIFQWQPPVALVEAVSDLLDGAPR
ncbi:exodeoxyribonuclease V subunit beta [Nocardioides salsibiostraticola]